MQGDKHNGSLALAAAIARAYRASLRNCAQRFNDDKPGAFEALMVEMRGFVGNPILHYLHGDLESVCLDYVNQFMTNKPKFTREVFLTGMH